jgi:hypothetical protein
VKSSWTIRVPELNVVSTAIAGVAVGVAVGVAAGGTVGVAVGVAIKAALNCAFGSGVEPAKAGVVSSRDPPRTSAIINVQRIAGIAERPSIARENSIFLEVRALSPT